MPSWTITGTCQIKLHTLLYEFRVSLCKENHRYELEATQALMFSEWIRDYLDLLSMERASNLLFDYDTNTEGHWDIARTFMEKEQHYTNMLFVKLSILPCNLCFFFC